jgi:TonB family protein
MKKLLLCSVLAFTTLSLSMDGAARAQDMNDSGVAKSVTEMLLLGMAVAGPAPVVEKALDAKSHTEVELRLARRSLDEISAKVLIDPAESAELARDQVIYQANHRVWVAKDAALDEATKMVLIVEKAAQEFERTQATQKEADVQTKAFAETHTAAVKARAEQAQPQNCVNCDASGARPDKEKLEGLINKNAPFAATAASPSAYLGEVSAEVRGRLFYPPAARARAAKGVVGVSFSIGASGAVTSFAITRSSGDRDLDAAARSLVQGARFPPPPGGSARISTSFNYSPVAAARL